MPLDQTHIVPKRETPKTEKIQAEKFAKIQKLTQDANNRNLINDLFSSWLKQDKHTKRA